MFKIEIAHCFNSGKVVSDQFPADTRPKPYLGALTVKNPPYSVMMSRPGLCFPMQPTNVKKILCKHPNKCLR